LQRAIELGVLAPLEGPRQSGYFDPENEFFLRTKAQDRGLLQVGVDDAGQRQLVGRAHGRVGPLPKARQDLFLYHPASETLVPFSTDKKGQFAVALPEAVKGEAFVFALGDDGAPSQAAALELP
jgi:hypothetical protein